MDPTVQVAVVGIFTTVVSTAGLVGVAIVNNSRKALPQDNTGMERALRERIILRDEQIEELKADLAECRAQKEES